MRTPGADHRPPAHRDPVAIWIDPLPDDDDTDDGAVGDIPAWPPDHPGDNPEMPADDREM